VGTVRYGQDVEVLPTLVSPPSVCRVARLATGDVYTSAVIAGRLRYPDAHTVVLAGSGAPLDGLVAAPLARVKNAPLLITPARGLPPAVSQDIASRGVTTAYLVGGTSAVGAAVERQVRALGVGTVVRLSGRDRYAVAAAVARQVGAGASAAVVVSGASLSDAAAAAGPAAATGRPLLLVSSSGVPAVTGSALKALRVRTVAVVGNTSVVPSAVVSRLTAFGVTSRLRITGADRAATAVAVVKAFSRPITADQVVVVPANNALGAVVGAGQARLLVFTDAATVPAVTAAWLAGRRPGSVALVGDVRSAQTSVMRQLFAATG
jgi:N-acetylmuramoyl-L-alanine amidase